MRKVLLAAVFFVFLSPFGSAGSVDNAQLVAAAFTLSDQARVAARPSRHARLQHKMASDPKPKPPPGSQPVSVSGGDWGKWTPILMCESGGNWGSTVGKFEGGLQFHPQTWDAYKPAGYPEAAYQATPEQQILVAERVLASQGWGAWPVCARKAGYR